MARPVGVLFGPQEHQEQLGTARGGFSLRSLLLSVVVAAWVGTVATKRASGRRPWYDPDLYWLFRQTVDRSPLWLPGVVIAFAFGRKSRSVRLVILLVLPQCATLAFKGFWEGW